MSSQVYLDFPKLDVRFLGPPLTKGACPTVLYFSLCAEESLNLDPYNQPAKVLEQNNIRIFSITLPGHGKGYDKLKAMAYWVENRVELSKFIQDAKNFILHLLEKKISTENIATMGLSRGGFIATHVGTLKEVKAILAFAPVTDLKALSESHNILSHDQGDTLLLSDCYKDLIYKQLRYYIGNRDVRVGTKNAFQFIYNLAEYAYQQRVRSMSAELFITPSTGQFGHGTLFHIFEEGANWLKKQIVQ